MTTVTTSSNKAMLLAVLAAVAMATIGVFSRLTGLPAVTVTFYRLLLGAFFMALWMLNKKITFSLDSQDKKSILSTGAFLAGFIVCYIEAMNRTFMANAILMVYLAPIAAAVYNRFIHHELLSRLQILSMLIALAGFVLLQDFGESQLTEILNSGMLFAALAMLFYAGFIINNRNIRGNSAAESKTFWQLLIGALCIVPFFMLQPSSIIVNINQWPWLLIIGLLPGFIAIYAAICALEKLPTAVYGTLTYAEPVAVILFGWLIFSEQLNAQQFIGAFLIIVSGLLQTVRPSTFGKRKNTN